MALAYLLDPAFEIVNTAGKPCTGGWIECYVHGTRDKYYCASDFDGTLHPFKIPLDSLGSNVVLAENSLSYDVYIYNRYGSLLMSRYNVIPSAGSGGGGGSDEYLEWMECEPMSITDGSNVPGVSDGTMTSDSDGLLVYEGHHYHITNSFTVVPTGDGISYDTFTVALMFDDDNGPVTLVSRSWDVDNSLNDSNEFEFSYDLVPSADGRVYWSVTGASSFSSVVGMMQVHRIYSGIAALPDTYARKSWVEQQISSSINYSALEYNTASQITAISGSAIAGGLDSASVSAIASSYAESAASSKMEASASSDFYPMTGNPSSFLTNADMSDYATTGYVDSAVSSKADQSAVDDCCSAMSGYVSALQDSATSLQQDVSSISAAVSAVTSQTGNYIDWSDSGQFQPSGNYMSSSDMSSYIPFSGLAGENNVITSISGSAVGSTASGGKTYTGIWPVVVDNTADTVAVENKTLAVDETMTGYESAGSAVIGVNTGVVLSSLTAYQPASAMTAYAYESSLSSKLDTTAFSTVSGDFLTSHQSLAGYATESYVDSSVSEKLDATASSQFLTSLPADLAYTSDVASAVSGKLDASASSEFYPATSNPSGYLTAHQSLAGYATEQYVDSAVSSKLDSSAYDSAWFQPVSAMTAYQPVGTYIYESALGWAEV